MKTKLFSMLVALFLLCGGSYALNTKDSIKVANLEKKVATLESQLSSTTARLSELQQADKGLLTKIDSLNGTTAALNQGLSETNTKLSDESSKLGQDIASANNQIEENNTAITNKVKKQSTSGIIIIAVIVLLALVVFFILYKKIKSGSSDINKIKAAQNAIQEAQAKIQEESVKLDEKLVSLLEKQINVAPTGGNSDSIDHSLVKKVADEIVRIETNLSRMDSSVKGHKQLSKAVERIRNNFTSKGYEIVEMLGKPYTEGMKVVANFVTDESLKEGEKIITGITKPQINYNGQMIQAAEITVSQNI